MSLYIPDKQSNRPIGILKRSRDRSAVCSTADNRLLQLPANKALAAPPFCQKFRFRSEKTAVARMAMEGREANKRLKNYHEASEDELEEEEEEEGDEDRGMSTDESTESSAHSSRCGSPTFRSNGDKKKKKLKNKNVNPKLNYKCIGYWKENHGHPIFGVSVNHHLDSSSPTVFATVGYNRVTIYEAMSGGIKLLQVNNLNIMSLFVQLSLQFCLFHLFCSFFYEPFAVLCRP